MVRVGRCKKRDERWQFRSCWFAFLPLSLLKYQQYRSSTLCDRREHVCIKVPTIAAGERLFLAAGYALILWVISRKSHQDLGRSNTPGCWSRFESLTNPISLDIVLSRTRRSIEPCSPLSEVSLKQSMSEKTHEVLISPAPGTIVAPIYQYSEQQKAQIKALRQARPMSAFWQYSHNSFSLFISMRRQSPFLKRIHIIHGSGDGWTSPTRSHGTCVLQSGPSLTRKSVSNRL